MVETLQIVCTDVTLAFPRSCACIRKVYLLHIDCTVNGTISKAEKLLMTG